MLHWWQTLPLRFDVTAFHIFEISIPWYTLTYLLGIVLATLFFVSLARRQNLLPNDDITIELITSVLWGVIIGARLGYILLYGDASYFREPWRIISPYDFSTGTWVGIRGLSFHGGLLGGAIGLWRFTREAGRHFWDFADALVQAIPIGIFFGRLGNFLNHEILGRATEVSWGMRFFPEESFLRHPVTLYEAVGEGILLFFFMALAARLSPRPGMLTAIFLIGYGAVRFFFEPWRDTPPLADVSFTMGQAASMVMVLVGTLLLFRRTESRLSPATSQKVI